MTQLHFGYKDVFRALRLGFSAKKVWMLCVGMTVGTAVYSIGYDLNAVNGGANKCTSSTGSTETGITAYQALEQIASTSDTFYNQPSAGQLNTLFQQVAVDIQRGASGLIDNDTN